MQAYTLDIKDFMNRALSVPVIDVRSPGEYEHGHIPDAINLPLFTNDERSLIGTLYLQKGSSEAMLKGLELIGPKMKDFAEKGSGLAPDGELLMHCWRGGMRSNSMAWLLNTAGLKTYTLEGGYKSYRRFTREVFETPFQLVVIGGMTGSGKSEVLDQLEIMGFQVIHLEKLASHKGSVFGGIGMPPQPTTEQFENNLCRCLLALDRNRPVFVEDESLSIGNIFIPRPFYDQMSAADFIRLKVPFDKRVQRLQACYHTENTQWLIDAVKRIEKRIGYEHAGKIAGCIQHGDLKKAAEILLPYYDKVYARSMSVHRRKRMAEISDEGSDPVSMAEKIAQTIPSFISN